MNSLSIDQLTRYPLFTVESIIDTMIQFPVMGAARHDIESVLVDYIYKTCRTEFEQKARDLGFMDQNDLDEKGYKTEPEWREEMSARCED